MGIGGDLAAQAAEVRVFEEAAALPAQTKESRRSRVSNGLAALAKEAAKLEGDFAYQYDYNERLVEEVAKYRNLADDAESSKRKARDDYQDEVATNKKLRAKINVLDSKVAMLLRPRRQVFWLAIGGWVLAFFALLALAQNFSEKWAQPIDRAQPSGIFNTVDGETTTGNND
jgi:hypothetical protein